MSSPAPKEAPHARVTSQIGPAAWARGGSDFSPLPAKQDSSCRHCERQAYFPTQHALHLSSPSHSCWAVTIFWWLFHMTVVLCQLRRGHNPITRLLKVLVFAFFFFFFFTTFKDVAPKSFPTSLVWLKKPGWHQYAWQPRDCNHIILSLFNRINHLKWFVFCPWIL